MTEYEDISRQLYEKRFWQRNDGAETINVVGYGVGNPYIPPLVRPPSILAVYDKFALTIAQAPIR